MNNYNVENNQLTSSQANQMQYDMLATDVDNNGLMKTNRQETKTTTLDTKYFPAGGSTRTIVRALNSIAKTEISISDISQQSIDVVGNTVGNINTNLALKEQWNKLKAVMGEENIIEGLLSYFCDGLNINLTDFMGNYDELDTSTSLHIGNIVFHENKYYKVITEFQISNYDSFSAAYTAGVFESKEVTNTNEIIQELETKSYINFVGEYVANTKYEVNDMIKVDNDLYLIITAPSDSSTLESMKDNIIKIGSSSNSGNVSGLKYDII